ncbi:MAG: hypothetical protein RLY31_1733 [Bacteroidota bacterium]|jgi:uncharacterized membrane protein YhiD involved in acid resistance
MFEQFQDYDLFRPSLFDFAANLSVALCCGMVIALVYRFTYRGTGYARSYLTAIVLLCLITAVVILVIGNNLARAFGLVGAMSVIRFRTAVRDTLDMVYIFFALAIGMAAGVGLNAVAVTGTLFISLVILLLEAVGFSSPSRIRHLLQVSHDGLPTTEDGIRSLLRQYARRRQLVNLRKLEGRETVEVFYQLSMRRPDGQEELVRALRSLPGVTLVNLFHEPESGT